MNKLLVRTMVGDVVELPKFPKTLSPIPVWNTWDDFDILNSDPRTWDNSRLTYLASADHWVGLAWFFENEYVKSCDVFYSIIGGLGGLNFIRLLHETKKIIFYDVNRYAVRILDLYLQLIIHCNSVNEFISLIYQRPFTLAVLDSFFSISINPEYDKILKSFLTTDAYETYNYFYLPCILTEGTQESNTIHCTHLLPSWDYGNTNSGMVFPLKEREKNINSFYVGKGWLSDDNSFLHTRQKLIDIEIEVLIGDVLDIKLEGKFPGNYMSNIFNTSEKYNQFSKVIDKYAWMIGYDDFVDNMVRYYPKGNENGI